MYMILYAVFMNLPHEQRKNRVQNLLNEFFFIVLLYHMLCMTEFIEDAAVQYRAGSSFLYIIIASMVFNIYISFG